MEKYYRIAGIELCVRGDARDLYTQERVLGPFAVDNVQNPRTFDFYRVKQLPKPKGERVYHSSGMVEYRCGQEKWRYIGPTEQSLELAHMCVHYSGTVNRVFLSAQKHSGISVNSVLNALGIEHLIVQNRGIILHSSYIVAAQGGIVFTAASGVGKSTQAELWRCFRQAHIINGDRSILLPRDSGVLVSSLPYAGSSGICDNITAPLKAIVCLQQAPVTTIHPLTGSQAFVRVWEGCCINLWDRHDVDLSTAVVQEIVERVPVFLLACTPDETAVQVLENMLGGGS